MSELENERRRLRDLAEERDRSEARQADVNASKRSRIDHLLSEFIGAVADRATIDWPTVEKPSVGWYIVAPHSGYGSSGEAALGQESFYEDWRRVEIESLRTPNDPNPMVRTMRDNLFLRTDGGLHRLISRAGPHGLSSPAAEEHAWIEPTRLRTCLAFTLELIERGDVPYNGRYIPASSPEGRKYALSIKARSAPQVGTQEPDEVLRAAARLYQRNPSSEEVEAQHAKVSEIANANALAAKAREEAARAKTAVLINKTGRLKHRTKVAAAAIDLALDRTARLLSAKVPANHQLMGYRRGRGMVGLLSAPVRFSEMVWELDESLFYPQTLGTGREGIPSYMLYLTPGGRLATTDGDGRPRIWTETKEFVQATTPPSLSTVPEEVQSKIVTACGRLLGHWGIADW